MVSYFQFFIISCSILQCISSIALVVVEPHLTTLSDNEDMLTPEDLESRRKKFLFSSTDSEEVCKTKIRQNHRPMFGHTRNGSQVEIQQDDDRNLVATFVECNHHGRPSCNGVDKKYVSECVTIYEHRTAFVRFNSHSQYFQASIRIPITCECRLRLSLFSFLRGMT